MQQLSSYFLAPPHHNILANSFSEDSETDVSGSEAIWLQA